MMRPETRRMWALLSLFMLAGGCIWASTRPDSIPLYPAAFHVYRNTPHTTTQFWTQDPPRAVTTFYRDHLPDWTLIKTNDDEDGGGSRLLLQQGNWGLHISAVTADNGLTVTELRKDGYNRLVDTWRSIGR